MSGKVAGPIGTTILVDPEDVDLGRSRPQKSKLQQISDRYSDCGYLPILLNGGERVNQSLGIWLVKLVAAAGFR